RGFYVLGELVEHEVPALRFPGRAARRPVHRMRDAARARRELHRRGTLRAEAALVDRAIGIALDLKELGRSVDFLRVRDERAAHSAIRAERMDLLRTGDAQVQRALFRRGDIETERVSKGNERQAGGAGGSELQELTTSE